jgi:hypothetical protein
MRFPAGCYQIERGVAAHLPHLRPAQRRGLALWVCGAILARSACQHAVVAALRVGQPARAWHALRQRLREWLYDGADKAAPCGQEVEVRRCFAPLLGWVLAWWRGDTLALAVSVLYRGVAIPVAWHALPANQAGAWMGPILRLLRWLRPAIPPGMTVLVLADRGLWSPRLWKRVRALGWHPLLRLQGHSRVQPAGRRGWVRATALVAAPGRAWVGRALVFPDACRQRSGTLIVWWGDGHAAPVVALTDLPPARVGPCWYGLRIWVELGFRVLKSLGWQWQRSRRTDPGRVARHWLVLAVATLWTVAVGTRVEDADARGVAPARLHTAPPPAPRPRPRAASVFLTGWNWLARQLQRGHLWTRLWLVPEPWPTAPPHLALAPPRPP